MSEQSETPLAAFLKTVPGVLSYPVRGHGVPTIIGAGVVFVVIQYLLSFAAIFGIGFTFSLTGYSLLYLDSIVNAAASDEAELPYWPETWDIWTSTAAVFRFLFLAALCFGPGLLCVYFMPWGLSFLPIVALTLGSVYFPMAFLALAITKNWGAILPNVVIPSIARGFSGYALLCAMVGMTLVVQGLLEAALGNVPVLGPLVNGVFSFYVLAVLGCSLGRFYSAYEGELGF